MTEEFLQYVWKHGLFSKEGLTTTQGEPLQIIHPGSINNDAGPDFFNASVKISGTLWAGNVEIHLKSSDWNRHGHQTDSAYNNVILHVVSEDDMSPLLQNGEPLPVLIPEIDQMAWDNYNELVKTPGWPACSCYLHQIDPVYLAATLNSSVIDRMQIKSKAVYQLLKETKNNWNEAFYIFLARSFGFKTNALPFELLARATPLKILNKHHENLFTTEAILFGQSGMLNDQLLGDDYFLRLREEYGFFAKKYHLRGVESHLWKFLRLRPANFPTLRLAQFACLMHQSDSLLSKIIESDQPSELEQLFKLKASPYWDTHFKFNTPARNSEKHLGEAACHNLLINAVAPFLFIYGEFTGNNAQKMKAIELLESLPSEENHIITRWKELGVPCQSAFDSQALIQLKTVFCDQKRCLNCQLGHKVIIRQKT